MWVSANNYGIRAKLTNGSAAQMNDCDSWVTN